MGHGTGQTLGWAFQTLCQAFQTLGWAFSFLLKPQKLGRVFQMLSQVFQKLCWAFQRLSRMFWNKFSTKSFDQQTHLEFLIIWSVKRSFHKSNRNPEFVTKLQISAFIHFKFIFSFFFLCLFFFFRYWLLNQDLWILCN